MKQIVIAGAILAAASMPAFAQNQGGNGGGNCQTNSCYHGAPGPVLGAGAPAIAMGLGYGVWWLRSRRRRKNTEV
jgi:hypothetical protein